MAASDEEGGGAWMRRRVEPSSVDENFKDGYVDMLAARRPAFNDLTWVLKKVKTPQYIYNHPRDYKQLIKDTLHSDRVQFTIEEIAKESRRDISEVKSEASSIITEMAHQFNMRSVRTLGYAIIKVFKRIFDHVYINSEGLQMLNGLVQEYPVLLIPSHRSYMDFLIFSIVCFDNDLPLPAIVAAQDFMGMFLLGTMLRNSGAFYIRRSFRTDKLYWAIFTEYVQTQLCNGDHPIEFFVEGTRSRTQKAMAPKLGMLAASLEAYFKGKVPDIMIVPVSISYDRVLEENLFAQELLGIPKPKESTSKLFKALSVLNENYGSAHVTLSQPLSVRSMAVQRIHRPIHNLEPRYIVGVTDEEEELIEDIGYSIIWQQQKHMVLSVWCLIATVMLQNTAGITLKDLTETVLWLKRHANNVGAYIDWPGGCSDIDVVKSCLVAHSSYVYIEADFVTVAVEHGDRLKLAHIEGETLADAATHIVLALYRNQLIHTFVPYSLLSLVVLQSQHSGAVLNQDQAYTKFHFLGTLMAKEFVLNKNELKKAFTDSLRLLVHTSDIILDKNGDILLSDSVTRFTTFLSRIIQPYIIAYWSVCQYLIHTTYELGTGKEAVVRPKELTKSVQHFALLLLNTGKVQDHEVLNLDILNNGVQALKDIGALYYEMRNGEKFAAARSAVLVQTAENLASSATVPGMSQEEVRSLATSAALKSKL